jgi:uncharacterized protein (TIGR00299 family) protein
VQAKNLLLAYNATTFERGTMRIAYLDCFAGIAGDMFLGALLDAGVPAEVLHNAVAALNLNASLRIETVDRSGISSTKVHVLEAGHPAEHTHEAANHAGAPVGAPSGPHLPAGVTRLASETWVSRETSIAQQAEPRDATYTLQPKTQHLHKLGHTHAHDEQPHTHEHTHHAEARSLTQIRTLITSSTLAQPIQDFALRAFALLGESEARIHNVAVDSIHFHEVGAVDAIVDIVASAAGIHHLQIGAWHSSPVNVGSGMVQCAHGNFPVPAPATADLLRGAPTYSAHLEKELTTPTGAAILRALNPTFGPQPSMSVSTVGYGAGTRNPTGFPNVLRLILGESSETTDTQTVSVLETALDDLSPQLLAHVTELALAQGALDVMLTPVIMKKGRPGTLLTVLANPGTDTDRLTQLILTETSTLGLRVRTDRRICLNRSFTTVTTPYGDIRIKLGTQDNQTLNAAPEFEDCKSAAEKHKVPLKQVQQAAIAAYMNSKQS